MNQFLKYQQERINSIINSMDLEKAEEGIYADTPKNRKLGLVGKKYSYLNEKVESKLSIKDQFIKEADSVEKMFIDMINLDDLSNKLSKKFNISKEDADNIIEVTSRIGENENPDAPFKDIFQDEKYSKRIFGEISTNKPKEISIFDGLTERNKDIFQKLAPKLFASTKNLKLTQIGSKHQNILIQGLNTENLNKNVLDILIKVGEKQFFTVEQFLKSKNEVEITIEDYEKLYNAIGTPRKTENGKELFKDTLTRDTWYEVPKLSTFIHYKGGYRNITEIIK